MNTTEQVITPDVIESAMDYEVYRALIDDLLEEGKTTGPKQSEKMTAYTRMNVHRMNRLDNQIFLSESLREQLRSIDEPWVWVVLTEAWCGDAAQNIPVIAKMAEQSDNVSLKLILRDENLDIMDQYLTPMPDGGRAIPKLVCLHAETLDEKGAWGPRPETPQSMMEEMKQKENADKKAWIKKIQKWYARNRAQELQAEFEELISRWQEG